MAASHQPLLNEAGAGSRRQPLGVYFLTLVEFWERFAFYSVFFLLALFLTASTAQGGAGWSDAAVVRVAGMFGGLAFVLPVVGGWIASRWLGNARCAQIGTQIGTVGYGLVAWYAWSPATLPSALLLTGLGLAAVGVGLFKPAVSALVGSFYAENDSERERGYILFMAGISAGALIGGVVCGWTADRFGWFWGLCLPASAIAIAAVLMIGGSAFFARAAARLGGDDREKRTPLVQKERRQIGLIMAFSTLNVIYITIYFQCFGTLNLFIERHVHREIFGVTVPTVWLSSWLNAAFVLACFVSSRVWTALDRTGRNPDVFKKQAIGFVVLSLAFLVLANAGWSAASAPDQMAALYLIVLAYGIFAAADVFTQPIQLNAAGGYAPTGYASLMIGIWILSTGIGSFLSGFIGDVVEPSALAGRMATASFVLAAVAVIAWLLSRYFRSTLTSHRIEGKPQP